MLLITKRQTRACPEPWGIIASHRDIIQPSGADKTHRNAVLEAIRECAQRADTHTHVFTHCLAIGVLVELQSYRHKD